MALTQTLIDNFNDNTTDLTKWTTFGTIAETGRQVQFTGNSGSANYSGYTSVVTTYDFTGSFVYCQLINAGNQALVTWQAIPTQVFKDASNSLVWYISGNKIVAQKQIAGSFTDVRNDVAYDSSVHKYFKVRESGGTIFWDFSTDNVTYTNYTSLANPFAITSCYLQLTAGMYASEASGSTATFDNFNTNGAGYSRPLMGVGV